MDGPGLRSVIRRIGRAVDPAARGGLTDAELLRRWLTHRDEGAFEALLWRHAAVVFGVCRRVLGDAHEAEDAAQAAFLALARAGGSIGRRQAVAAWLHTAAYRAALRVRARRPRGRALSPDALHALPSPPGDDPAWRDLRPVLDEEVSRLPEKLRVPFVLCHVGGRTNEEAARELGCPVGTVLSRLARARAWLRARLTRRGVTPAALTAAAGEAAAAPGVAIRAAVRAAAGDSSAGAVSAEVGALTEGVVRAMLPTKVKLAAAVLAGLALLGGGVAGYRTAAGGPGGLAPTGPAVRAANEARPREPPSKGEDKEVTDLRARVKALEGLLAETRRLDLAGLARTMRGIQERLASGAGGKATQEMQKDLLARLDQVIQNVESQQKAAPDGRLNEVAAELKLLRAMQARVNARTELCGKGYQGETVPATPPASDPKEAERLEAIRRELKELGERQGKIAQITGALSAGKQEE
jgi:RNA polymerase sigma factor (sigma-70 family)